MKKILLVLLSLIICSCSTVIVPKPDPKPETPPTVENPKILALDSFDHPEDSKESDWKSSVTRTIFNNQKTGYVVKGELCLLAGEALKLLPITTKYPSAKTYKVGIHYDALVPLTLNNCKDAVYAYLELSESYGKNGLTVTLVKNGLESKEPTIPLLVELSPYSVQMGLDKGVYVNGHEALGLPLIDMLIEHRLQPYKTWITEYKLSADLFKKYVLEKSVTLTNIADNYTFINNNVIEVPNAKNPWVYLVDEPTDEWLASNKSKINALKAKYPNLPLMVTTTCKKDYPFDIYAVVPEQWNMVDESCYVGKRKWMYTACMANGCGINRAWLDDVNKFEHYDYNRSGSPDFAIDAPLTDLFGFYMLGVKYNTEALLYYNTTEQWSLIRRGVDVFADQYNYGGNGDGTLLYPDFENLSAYTSLRLKMLREASFMIDAAKANNKLELIKSKVSSPLSWTFEYSLREEVYKK